MEMSMIDSIIRSGMHRNMVYMYFATDDWAVGRLVAFLEEN